MMVERLFLMVPRGCLQFVIVVFPDQTHLLFLVYKGLTTVSTNCHVYTNVGSIDMFSRTNNCVSFIRGLFDV